MTAAVLAIETSTTTGSIALVTPVRLLAEITLESPVSHGERILGAIVRVLDGAGLRVPDLAGIAVSAGPGSFTGLRVGMATAKGLVEAHRMPLAAVPTLEALAWNLPLATDPVCAILDARKGEVYGALFAWDAAEEGWRRILAEGAFTPDDLASRVGDAIAGRVLLLGDGVPPSREAFARRMGERAVAVPAPACQPRAAWTGWIGLRMIARGEVEDAVTLEPMYCRASEAELALSRASRGGDAAGGSARGRGPSGAGRP